MDAATFVVSMVDKVSKPAHDAAQAVDNLNKRLKKTGSIGFQFTGKGDAPDVLKRLNRQALGLWAKSRTITPALKKVGAGVDWVSDKFVGMVKYGTLATIAAGGAAAAYAIKGTVHMAQFAETTRLAFGLLTGDKDLGERVFSRTIELSKQLGMDVETTAHSMQKLLAMQMSPADAEKWLKLGADLRSVGVDAGALQRVMLDIAHVKATGKLNTRNVNMFANAGVSAQLLMEEIGKAMGTDQKGAMEAMHHGKITSDIALPALERAIMRKTHSHEAGDAGAQFANQTLSGLIERLKNAPSLFFLKMADKAKGAIDKLKPLVDAVYKAIDGIQGDSFVRFVTVALDKITQMVPLAMEFAAGFGDGFSEVIDAMATLEPGKSSMQSARDLGHSIADAFGVALKTVGKIIEAMQWLDQHPTTAKFLGGALALNSLSGGGLIGGGAGLLGKGLLKGGKALAKAGAGALGFGAAKAAVAGTAATTATTAATTTAATTAAVGAETAAGATGAAALVGAVGAWAGTAVAAASVGALALAILPGLIIAAAGYFAREKIMGWVMGERTDVPVANHRGLDATDVPTATPTLAGIQKAAQNAGPRTNNVTLHTTVNVDGEGKDGAQVGKDIAQHQRDGLEQFFQSHALESGAM